MGNKMTEIDEFVVKMLAAVPQLSKEYDETISDWIPNTPPILILLASLGRGLADLNLTDDILKKVLEVIECGVKSENNILSTATTTGLLEAFYFRVENNQNIKQKVLELLGENSKKYIIALNEFHGV